MTAHRNTGWSGKKASQPTELDAETLLAVVQDQERTTIEGLAKRSGTTERDVRRLLMELRQRDLVDVERGLRAVFVEPTDRADRIVEQREDGLATDGGPVQKLVHALTKSPETVDITEAELYETLSNPRRRRILRYLAVFYDDQGGVFVDVRTISDALADRIVDENPGAARDDDLRHRHYVSVSQQHAPALDEAGLAEYFEQVNKIRATEDGVAVASLMNEISDLCADVNDVDGGEEGS